MKMMTPEQIVEIVKWLGIIAAGIIGYVKTMNRHYKYLEQKVVEKSVGQTAVAKLSDEDKSIRRHIEDKSKEILNEVEQLRQEFEDKDDKRSEEIRKLAGDIRDFTFSALKAWNSVLINK